MRNKLICQLYSKHTGKVSDKWSLYLSEYEQIFRDYKKDIKLLEIGVQNGGSLEIWSQVFPKAKILIGCDINEACKNLEYQDPRVQIIVGDANSDTAYKSITELSETFDIIIDDGSHKSSDIIKSFSKYFKNISYGGIYIIEDLHCSYWQNFEGGLYNPLSSISFFKQLIDILNYEHWGLDKKHSDILADFAQTYNIDLNEVPLTEIHSVEFINSMCVIRKLPASDNLLGKRHIAGETAIVVSNVLKHNATYAQTPNQKNNRWSERTTSENEQLQSQANEIKKLKTKLDQIKDNAEIIIQNNKTILELRSNVLRLENSLSDKNQYVDSLKSSTSWKITAPYRFLGNTTIKAQKAIHHILQAARDRGGFLRSAHLALKVLKRKGWQGVQERLFQLTTEDKSYSDWINRYSTVTPQSRAQMTTISDMMDTKPLISIVMPVYNPNLEWLSAAVSSVQNQLYPHWELCIADDCSTNPEVKAFLKELQSEDSRIRVIFRETNGHISNASNSAIERVTGPWITLMDQDDLLPEDALFHVAYTINMHPDAGLIYSDEDKIDETGTRFAPYFKSDWNPDLFLSHNMISHLGTYRTDLVRELGGFRPEYNGSQDYDLALRFVEKLKPEQIIHIPRILYHWRSHSDSTAAAGDNKGYALIAGKRAIESHLQRTDVKASVHQLSHGYRVRYDLPEHLPSVSLIIPTRNGLSLLRQCIESILEKTTYPNYEIIIIDNNSDDPATLTYLAECAQHERISVIRDERAFNYSALNNNAVDMAKGDYIALINNDIEVISPDWLEEMLGIATQPGVGAVGAALWYPNDTLQHGGVIIGLGGVACHAHKGIPRGEAGYCSRAKLTQSMSAVTAACLIVEKAKFEEVGGLNEQDLTVAFNDVDFCLKLLEAGYRNVWTPFAELYHHESASRGNEDSPEKQKRFQSEIDFMRNRWNTDNYNDPAYSPNLTLNTEDFSFAWPSRARAPLAPEK